ncbi:MAG TPA: type 1 glutamine amidotransferase domain-containing protein [Bacillota bacterium]|nr:type 1 glutamine amidotransferase domain-containing protein [Bacillota bacterium]
MRLEGKKVLTVLDDNFNDLELWYPVYRLQEEGATTHFAGPEADKQYKGQFGIPATSDFAYADINPDDYDALLIPGGWAPDKIRRFPEALDIVRAMDKAGKTIGSICHAGWVLVSADVLKGVKSTSTPAIKDDMANAGADWVNEETVVDGHMISSRSPADMPVYVKAIADHIAK